jgi:hypothetical protein
MIEKAFVLINTNDHMDDSILLDELKKIDGISEAYRVCGIYDILIKGGGTDSGQSIQSSQSQAKESEKY